MAVSLRGPARFFGGVALGNDLSPQERYPASGVGRSGLRARLTFLVRHPVRHIRSVSVPLKFVQIDNTDEGQVTVILVQVETVTEDEFVGDFEATIMDGDNHFAALGFVQQ